MVAEGVKNGSAAECMICQEVVTYVKAVLAQPGTEKTIEEILDEACDLVPLPSQLKTEVLHGSFSFFGNKLAPFVIFIIHTIYLDNL
jgi:hypothetical protein